MILFSKLNCVQIQTRLAGQHRIPVNMDPLLHWTLLLVPQNPVPTIPLGQVNLDP